MQICPVNNKWIHTFLVAPYLEGAQLLNRAVIGKIEGLSQSPLSLKTRAISFLIGTALLLFPLVNSVIWVTWQFFKYS